MKALFHPKRGCTIRIPFTGPDHDKGRPHLHIILTDTCSNGENLLVPVCTKRPGSDGTCLLGLGDHDRIVHPSVVMYMHLELYAAQVLRKKVVANEITYEGVLEDRIFARVCQGVIESTHVAPKFRKYYIDQTSPAVEVSVGRVAD